MANRTVQIIGQGYGDNPAVITVTVDGNTVFSGEVATVDKIIPSLPDRKINSKNILCTFDIPFEFTGHIPITCAVSRGTVIFTNVDINYVNIVNPVYTPEQVSKLNINTAIAERLAIWTAVANPPLDQQEINSLLDPAVPESSKMEILAPHNCKILASSGNNIYGDTIGGISNYVEDGIRKSSITINGLTQAPKNRSNWWWTIPAGSTLAYRLKINPAVI